MDIIASARSRSVKLRSSSQNEAIRRSNTAEYGSLTWTFDASNHYLHPILVNIVYSKAARWTIVIVMLPLVFVFVIPEDVLYIYGVLIMAFVIIPFLLLTTFSFNRDARAFIVKSSEFWMKIAYAVAKALFQFIRYHLVTRHTRKNEASMYMGYTACILALISAPLIMVVVGGMDAIPKLTHKWKAILMGIASVWYTLETIRYQFMQAPETDYIFIIETTRSQISLNSLLSNASGMLAMFLCKQAIDVIRNKDRCISIAYRPYLQWRGSVDAPGLIYVEQMPKCDDDVNPDIDYASSQESGTRGFSILDPSV